MGSIRSGTQGDPLDLNEALDPGRWNILYYFNGPPAVKDVCQLDVYKHSTELQHYTQVLQPVAGSTWTGLWVRVIQDKEIYPWLSRPGQGPPHEEEVASG